MARILIVALILGVTAGLVCADDGQNDCNPCCGDCCRPCYTPTTACWYYWWYSPRLCRPCGYWNWWMCPDIWNPCEPPASPDGDDDDTGNGDDTNGDGSYPDIAATDTD